MHFYTVYTWFYKCTYKMVLIFQMSYFIRLTVHDVCVCERVCQVMNSYYIHINVNFLIYRLVLLRFGQFKGLDNNSFMLLVFSFLFSHCIWFVTDAWNCNVFCRLLSRFLSFSMWRFQVANSKNALNVPFILFFSSMRRLFFFPYILLPSSQIKIIIEFNLNGELPTRFIFRNSRLLLILCVHSNSNKMIRRGRKNWIQNGKTMFLFFIFVILFSWLLSFVCEI